MEADARIVIEIARLAKEKAELDRLAKEKADADAQRALKIAKAEAEAKALAENVGKVRK